MKPQPECDAGLWLISSDPPRGKAIAGALLSLLEAEDPS